MIENSIRYKILIHASKYSYDIHLRSNLSPGHCIITVDKAGIIRANTRVINIPPFININCANLHIDTVVNMLKIITLTSYSKPKVIDNVIYMDFFHNRVLRDIASKGVII